MTDDRLRVDAFDYHLPEELIAQKPADERDHCRLLLMDRTSGHMQDLLFYQIEDYLRPGDLLVANETRVLPARLIGHKRSGAEAEILLLKKRPLAMPHKQKALWEALVRPGKRLKPGSDAVVEFRADGTTPSLAPSPDSSLAPSPDSSFDSSSNSSPQSFLEPGTLLMEARIVDWVEGGSKGTRLVELTTPLSSLDEAIHLIGKTPLPPYIKGYGGDMELYQTVYATRESSAAAPTAGLHFTKELLDRLRAKGVGFQTVELQVGLDTFRIPDEEYAEDHKMHSERYSVSASCVAAIEQTKKQGGRVIAVGTTSVRSLESAWDMDEGRLIPRTNETTTLYIMPGYHFQVVDGLITNFHVPKSTLMMLVSAFAGRESILKAYDHAVYEGYRMLSFGDAMFII